MPGEGAEGGFLRGAYGVAGERRESQALNGKVRGDTAAASEPAHNRSSVN